MTATTHHDPPAARRGSGDKGAALVEFALVSVLLFTLIFGIISFGLLLSFKQDLTRAAAEGARAGAVEYPREGALAAANSATEEAVNGFGMSCDVDGLECDVVEIDCPGPQCRVEVRLEFDYENNSDHLIAKMPFVSAFLPDTISATSVARENS